MKNTLETRLGIFVALVVIAAVLIIETLGGIERFGRGLELRALFNTVQELKIGDRVKMGGVEVGRVEDITLAPTNNKVVVLMKLRGGTIVKTDSTASVKFSGLLGQNFVSLDFGGPESPLATKDTYLPTIEQPDLSVMMQKLDDAAKGIVNLTGSISGDKIDNLLGPFTDFLRDNRVPLTAAIANLQAISTQISQGKGTVGKLIFDDSLYTSTLSSLTNLDDVASQIKLAVADARKVVDQVNAGQGSIGKLLHDDRLYQETTASMTNLKEILEKINQGQGTIGKVVNDEEMYRNAKMTLQKLDKATEGLEDQGPLSVMGILVGKLF